jgi:lipid-A-disaccharide synthase
MLSCGEASGDLYAGALTRELLGIDPSLRIAGLGGPQFKDAGGQLIDDYRDIAVTGLTEAIRKVPRSLAALRRLVAAARRDRPDALVVIDSPDFNFRLAPQVKRLGVPIIYYISPQIWAWRPGRLNTIRGFADRVLVIFPFEETIYREAGVPVEFVGHPLVDLARPTASRAEFLTRRGLSSSAPTVAILPGSRPNEVARILPTLVAAARRIRRAVPGAQFVVARAPHLDDRLFDREGLEHRGAAFSGSRSARLKAPHDDVVPVSDTVSHAPSDTVSDTNFVVVEGDTDTVLASADVALTASGTATVQCALHDTPMVIVYRVSPITYRLGRRLVTIDTIGMVNLIAGEKIVPELVQDAFTPDAVAREATSVLTDRARSSQIRDGLARVRARLGGPGASRRAAEAILNIVRAHGRADPGAQRVTPTR